MMQMHHDEARSASAACSTHPEEVTNIMQERTVASPALRALSVAGICAFFFGVAFFLLLFATILMAGDGSAPAVTYWSTGIIDFTVKLLGVKPEGGIVPTVGFWTVVVFVLVLPSALVFYSRRADE
jgi:hypothetical protein